jgi:hypothetical protein
MTNPGFRFYQLVAASRERGSRLIFQGVEFVRLIAASEGHPGAGQLYIEIKRQFPVMNHAND